MVDAAEWIVIRIEKRKDEQEGAASWLRRKREEIGLTSLAKMLR
jgi:hypothetical protein